MKIEIYHENDGTFTVYAAEQEIPRLANLLLANNDIELTQIEQRAISDTLSPYVLVDQEITHSGFITGIFKNLDSDIGSVYSAIEKEFGYLPLTTDLRKEST